MFDFVKPPKLARSFFKDLVFSLPNNRNEIYLTFDDGPNPTTTPRILETLKEKGVKATFFCLGKNVEKHPKLFESIITQGHEIGNHGYHHLNGWKTDTKTYLQNVEKAAKLIPSTLFRPPYGKILPTQIKSLKEQFNLIMWDVSAQDYRTDLLSSDVQDNVIHHTKSGSILVLHDSDKAAKHFPILSPTIDVLLSNGFVFKGLKL